MSQKLKNVLVIAGVYIASILVAAGLSPLGIFIDQNILGTYCGAGIFIFLFNIFDLGCYLQGFIYFFIFCLSFLSFIFLEKKLAWVVFIIGTIYFWVINIVSAYVITQKFTDFEITNIGILILMICFFVAGWLLAQSGLMVYKNMKKINYKAWNINTNDFKKLTSKEAKIKFLVNFAVLAPSSHNSQPWTFITGKNFIKVLIEKTRKLPVGDANDRQLFISLGCAIENIVTAADYYGYSANVDFNCENNCIAIIRFASADTSSYSDHLIFSISERLVNRGKYQEKQVSQHFLDLIKDQENQNLKISVVWDSGLKNKLADIALSATSMSMADPAFRKELSHYVISNTSSKKYGMPGFSLGFPTPISYFASFMLKMFNLSKLSRKQDEPVLKLFTPYMVIVSTKEDKPEDWLAAGRAFQQMSLLATARGISFAVWEAPIQIGEYYRDIQKILGLDFRPQMFFRMGYTIKNIRAHSPRFPAAEVIKYEQKTGNK